MAFSLKSTVRNVAHHAKYRVFLPFRIGLETLRDWQRYSRHSAFEEKIFLSHMTQKAIEAQVTKDYHRVEKGLALGSPKRPFGLAVARRLDALIPELEPGTQLAKNAQSSRAALQRWNDNGLVDDTVSPVPPASIDVDLRCLTALFESRHSVRHFDGSKPVSKDVLNHAAELAMATPSVCNRQPWRVRFALNSETKQVLRDHQNGNAGFGEIPVIALITVDTRLFSGPGERNQAWIDGGLYAMSLNWALHGLGLASCMLNMSVNNVVTDSLRSALDIPDHELIIMQMAIGVADEKHRVARSPRRVNSEVVSYFE